MYLNIQKFISFILALLVCTLSFAQQKSDIKVGNADTLYLKYEEKKRQEAAIRRIAIEDKLAAASPDSLTTINLKGLYYKSLPDLSAFDKLKILNASIVHNKMRSISVTKIMESNLPN